MGICVANRPHVGHMLLTGVVEIARRSIGNETTPVVIHANDTGPRIAQTIAKVAADRKITEEEALRQIEDGRIDSGMLEYYYQIREEADKTSAVRAESVIKNHHGILPRQAQEHLALFSKFFGNDANDVVLESDIEASFGHQDALNNPAWFRTGTSFTELHRKRYWLESNGFLTSAAAQSATLNYAAHQLQRGMPLYINGDQSITDSMELLRAHTGIEGIQFSGAAIGFGMKVGSGTSGNSIIMEDFLKWYDQGGLKGKPIDDIVCLLSTRYYLKPLNEHGYYDYANKESFLNDVAAIIAEGENIKLKAEAVIERIKSITRSGMSFPKYSCNERTAKHFNRQILRMHEVDTRNEREMLEKLFLNPEEMRETPQVQRLVDRMAHRKGSTKREAQMRVLTSIAGGDIDAQSNVVAELMRHGYRSDALMGAIHKFVDGHFVFMRMNSLLHRTLESVEEIIALTSELDEETSALFLKRYKEAYSKLFRTQL